MIKSKKIWIDLENTPHVLFFNPIIKELNKNDYEVIITARDYAQVFELADLFNLDYIKVGHHYGKNKIIKIIGLLIRSIQLIPIIIKFKPIVAIAHGSRSQMVLGKIFGLTTITSFDYEHVKILPSFFRPDISILPELLPEKDVAKFCRKIYRYPGIKEDISIHSFVPDSSILESVGISDRDIVVTIRPPAEEAHYHSDKSDLLFDTVMDCFKDKTDVKIVVVPRTKDQKEKIYKKWNESITNGRIIIPDHAVNGFNLIWHSDLVISAGGTMIREAVALGVPAYSIFGGKLGAVDRYLNEVGRLVLINSAEEVCKKIKLTKRDKNNVQYKITNESLNKIIDIIRKVIDNKIT